jgi:hypothetical protein
MHHKYEGMWSRLPDPLSRVLLEMLTVAQLLKEFFALYRTVFTTAHHWTLSWTTFIQPIPPHPISLRSILISFNLRLGPASDPLPSDSPATLLYALISHAYCMPYPLRSPWFDYRNIVWRRVTVMTLVIIVYSILQLPAASSRLDANTFLSTLRCYDREHSVTQRAQELLDSLTSLL